MNLLGGEDAREVRLRRVNVSAVMTKVVHSSHVRVRDGHRTLWFRHSSGPSHYWRLRLPLAAH